ncbi:exopolygalacturonase-like [Hibiscus syriacus]|uniref:Pectinesterase n=1 Tax=Hibiscus syriacus TaxID=106335 RepID=A0A6A3BE66_HIBSY|nr:exopolygalacturonase-like [Hibiscus syriacus]
MGKAPAIIGVCSVILVAMVVAVAVGVTRSRKGGGSDEPTTSTKAVQTICQPTDYKQACENSLADTNTTDQGAHPGGFPSGYPRDKEGCHNSGTIQDAAKDPMSRQALENCKELISKLDEYVKNLKIWMGGSITYQQTCLDGFVNVSTEAGEKMRKLMNTSQMLTSNGLAMVSEIPKLVHDLNIPGFGKSDTGGAKRRLMAKDGFPSWVSFRQRKLLLQNPSQIRPNVVVAKDGWFYNEYVIVDKHMSNVVIGDGPTRTTITGRLNFVDGTATFKTATVAVIGPKFMAKNIRFENSAGAIKHQAVALKVQGDQSIFHNCQMDGYQDTLYSHSHRQYYRDCTVSGTIDFVFGDAASVYQNCKFIVRKPLDKQQCMVTAQGREDRREDSGFVFQNCTFTGAPDYLPVKARSKTYLGRPWKIYSRTIIMQSQLDDIVAPDGWMPWEGNFALDTLWYAEFNNRGPGAVQTNRVKWRGIQKINGVQAQQFTAGVFLRGGEWIQNAGVPYIAGMIPGL